MSAARRVLSGDQPEECGFAGTVGTDERGVPAVRDAQRDTLEQQASPRERVGEVGDLDDRHGGITPSRTARRNCRPPDNSFFSAVSVYQPHGEEKNDLAD